MRQPIFASAVIVTLLLGGCHRQRQTHVFVPGVEAREWWYPSAPRSADRVYQGDEIGRMAWVDDRVPEWTAANSLSASDALGGASFYDTAAYVQARRQERQDAIAAAAAE